ncbi:nuclear transport factor 2 family protein [Poritiphilus flavus]|uniref:Nuclear transport factor 2 family protein n=1 Tax=Poritiphilus flavus TaxID=2697053 RepID=A0A6L9EFB5_9FLAO|nr:nuclear transport factor 2 family protein [Poritiphilus flavus]NAS13437.1 nuclear transport factor 2 family protein [Poritiphilus flavus]
MKNITLLVILLLSLHVAAQSEEMAVQKTIEAFFDGFHKQDSIIMKQTVSEEPILQTIGKNKEGETLVRTEKFEKLIKSIVSIPDSVKFQEKLLSFNIQIDGAMANAWTPYEFWLNDKFHHCGVNSFQLFNDGSGWKIIYLIDTRRREGCQ